MHRAPTSFAPHAIASIATVLALASTSSTTLAQTPLANWRRTGQAPTDPRADLKTELRPALDKLRTQFIDELIATQRLREASDCKTRMAKATTSYAESRRLMPLQSIALDRGLARVCGD